MPELTLPCPYFADARCRSCTWLELPYAQQRAAKQASLTDRLAPLEPHEWQPMVHGAIAGFRHRAKLVVGGVVDHPTLGILGADGTGTDLCDCPLYPSDLPAVFDVLKEFIKRARLTPYRVTKRRGELKYVLLTRSYAYGSLLLRFVLRSMDQVPRIREHLAWLQAKLPALQVISVNLQPRHVAEFEGDEEILLTEQSALPERLNDVPLYLRPQSFFQTHPEVAEKLYATSSRWVDELPVTSLWDLFCGVGGFGLHCAGPTRELVGIESNADAIASARQSADEMGLPHVRFATCGAEEFAFAEADTPELVLVNPPRRGIGQALCERLTTLAPRYILYSSCHAETLLRDVQAMPDHEAVRVQCFDMFPHTDHCETLVLLARKSSAGCGKVPNPVGIAVSENEFELREVER